MSYNTITIYIYEIQKYDVLSNGCVKVNFLHI